MSDDAPYVTSDGHELMPTVDRLKELLVGHKIVATSIRDAAGQYASDGYNTRDQIGTLTLDDGTELEVWGNDGGCGCSAGCYPLTALNTIDNGITNVEVEEHPTGDDEPCRTCGDKYCYEHDDDQGYLRIFVVAEDQRMLVASFEGSDGNGYYGTGWWLRVKAAI